MGSTVAARNALNFARVGFDFARAPLDPFRRNRPRRRVKGTPVRPQTAVSKPKPSSPRFFRS
jgi:hypothetical protein